MILYGSTLRKRDNAKEKRIFLLDKVVILRSDGQGFVSPNDTYEIVDADYIASAKSSVERFFKFFFDELSKKFDFEAYFGVSRESLKLAQSVAFDDLDTYIRKGVSLACDTSDKEEKISETFFFYPLKGVLNVLSTEIAKQFLQSQKN